MEQVHPPQGDLITPPDTFLQSEQQEGTVLEDDFQDPVLGTLESFGVTVEEYMSFMASTEEVGGSVAMITQYARAWARNFAHDPDVHFLVKLAATGAQWEYSTEPSEDWFEVPNYVPDEHWDKVDESMRDDITTKRIVAVSSGRVVGLIAIGVVDKEHSGFVKVRIISDYSRPEGTSLNDSIVIEKVKFETVKSAYPYMLPHYFMAKIDLTKAYRSVPVAMQFWERQGFQWDDKIYMDLRMPFGNKAAPGIFHRITMAIQRYMHSVGFPGVVGYLDDFLIIAKSHSECLRGYNILLKFLRQLGFEVNEGKCVLPCQSLIFLGIQLDTNINGAVMVSLCKDKVARVMEGCSEMCGLQWVSMKKLESHLGLLVFCSQVVPGASLYLRSGFSLLHQGVTVPGYKGFLFVTREFALDMAWWVKFLGVFNGKRVRLDKPVVLPSYFTLDASTVTGMGGFLEGKYFAVIWEEFRQVQRKPFYPFKDEATSHINYLELFAVYWALRIWGSIMQGKRLCLWTDSMVVRGMMRRFWGKSTFIPLLKEIFVMTVKYDVSFQVEYIHTKSNVLSDSLSRQDWPTFYNALRLWKAARFLSRDEDNWMVRNSIVKKWVRTYGQFDVDACCDAMGANKQCLLYWTEAMDARVQRWHGKHVVCNPPYSVILQILLRFLVCKCEQPLGTAAVFIVPYWEGEDFLTLIESLPGTFIEIGEYKAGAHLYTAPIVGSARRKDCGGTHWDVRVYRVEPGPMTENVDWNLWESSVFVVDR